MIKNLPPVVKKWLIPTLALVSVILVVLITSPQAELANIVNDFFTILLGITVEALPFVVLGVIVSVIVELYVTPEWILARIPKNKFLSHPIISLLGIVMPVCECGNVPVVRRFMLHGFSMSQATTFLLAAPIVNPITFFSTWEAFGFDKSVAIIRLVSAFLIANIIGLIFSYSKDQDKFLTDQFKHEIACAHDHDQDSKLDRALRTFREEFVNTTKLLIFGAAVAAFTQTVIPRSIIESIGASPFLSVVAMIVLAFVVSICANVDAFFALAYAGTFTKGSLLAFMIFGPMIDIKMLSMLKNTYTPKALAIITILVTLMSVLVGVVINLT
jgi:uncharacterized membrane protein YraQ (UPF0718 family)